MRNQMKNELPFMRPTTPPATPKKKRMTSSPEPCMKPRLLPDEGLKCPQHGEGDCDGDDDPDDGHHEADDDLQGDRGGREQHDECEEPAHQRWALMLELYL